jgi:sec-independent protein translocase protein TatA
MAPIFAEILGWEALLVLAVIALLFGGSRLPHLARSLGSAKSEFEKGLQEGKQDDPPEEKKASE